MAEISEIKSTVKTVEILSPATDLPLNIQVDLLPRDHERMKKFDRMLTTRQLALQRAGKTMMATEIDEKTVEMIATAVVGWNWNDNTFHGVVPEYSAETVKAVLNEKDWFKKQLEKALQDETGFFLE